MYNPLSACIKFHRVVGTLTMLAFTLFPGFSLSARQTSPQNYKILYSFGANGDGLEGGVIVSGNMIYGTTAFGDNYDNGEVFSVRTDGTGYTSLHVFSEVSNFDEGGTNSDGAIPFCTLVLGGSVLYGTTTGGGNASNGVVFAINVGGTGFRTLHNFTNGAGGAQPQAGLALAGGTLYGTTYTGGTGQCGTVFSISTNGTGFATLHNFAGTQTDGGAPTTSVIVAGGTVYGTSSGANTSSAGTVFSVNTNGTGFRTLHAFNSNDGDEPSGSLILSSNVLYGTTAYGGPLGQGSIFAITTNASSFTNLYDFPYDNAGASPMAGLTIVSNTLYGTTRYNSNNITGTIFSINVNGTGLTYLHYFGLANGDSGGPYSSMFLSGNTLYGTTYFGGSIGAGSIYTYPIPVPPTLAITSSGNKVILTWTNTGALYSLQSCTNLPLTSWTAVPNAPAAVFGANACTNSTSATAMFYRLQQ